MNARSRLVLLFGALTAFASAAAWELRVDDSGGPADLADRVDVALAAWRAAGAAIDEVERTVLVRYASADLLGPDALTLVVTGGPPGVDLEVLVRPDAGATLDDALVVALGIALGGRPGVGVLAPRLLPDEPRLPSADDVTALAPGRGLPGDVTGDGRVGFADLLALAEAWGRRGINVPADLDGDGVVGEGDLERLREHYQFSPLGDEAAEGEAGEPPLAAPPSGAPADEALEDAHDDATNDQDDEHDDHDEDDEHDEDEDAGAGGRSAPRA